MSMMMGIGTPSSQSSIPRPIIASSVGSFRVAMPSKRAGLRFVPARYRPSRMLCVVSWIHQVVLACVNARESRSACRKRALATSDQPVLSGSDLRYRQAAGGQGLQKVGLGLRQIEPRSPVAPIKDHHLPVMNRRHIRTGFGCQ
jgi:hypothetical protein